MNGYCPLVAASSRPNSVVSESTALSFRKVPFERAPVLGCWGFRLLLGFDTPAGR